MKEIVKQLFVELFINIVLIAGIYFLWNWFMSSLVMAKQINFLEAWGLRTLVQFCTWHRDYRKK